jgi:hypothetical protein
MVLGKRLPTRFVMAESRDLAGTVVAITGATSGIGRATARAPVAAAVERFDRLDSIASNANTDADSQPGAGAEKVGRDLRIGHPLVRTRPHRRLCGRKLHTRPGAGRVDCESQRSRADEGRRAATELIDFDV